MKRLLALFSLLFLFFGLIMTDGIFAQSAAPTQQKWGLVIHGGAGKIERGKIEPEKEAKIRAALDLALKAGSDVLSKGGSAIDAVQAAVIILEDDPHFNAGKGAVLTYDGSISLDAAIMDGKTRAAGAVAGLNSTRNPILAARKVMEASPHVLLTGLGANSFAVEQGLKQENQDYFETPERRLQLDEFQAKKTGWYDVDLKYGTVGAVAVDAQGNVAAATSTGGLTGKRWGRVGDSPIIGAGTIADNRGCAVSATGSGEYFIRASVAHEICARMRLSGEKAVPAARAVMDEVKTMGGSGGVIVITPDGQMGWSFNTPGMYRAGIDSSGNKRVAMYDDE